MSPLDDELRRALAAHADDAALQTDPLAGIEREAKSIRRRRTGGAVLGAAMSVALVALALPALRSPFDAETREDRAASTPTPDSKPHPQMALVDWPLRGDDSVLSESTTAAGTAWMKLHSVSNRTVSSDVLYADRWSGGSVQAVLMHDPEGQFYNSDGDPVYDNYRLVWYLQGQTHKGRIVFEQTVDVLRPNAAYSLELPDNQTAIVPAPGADITVELGEREVYLGDQPAVVSHSSYETVRIRAGNGDPKRVNGGAAGIPVTAWGPRGASSVVSSLQTVASAALANDHPEVNTPVALWGGRADSGSEVVLVAGEIRGHGRLPKDSAWVAGVWVQPTTGPGRLVAVHKIDLGAVSVTARVLTSVDGASDPWIVVVSAPGSASSYHPNDNHGSSTEPESNFLETRWQREEPGSFQGIWTWLIQDGVDTAVSQPISRGEGSHDI